MGRTEGVARAAVPWALQYAAWYRAGGSREGAGKAPCRPAPGSAYAAAPAAAGSA